MGSIREARYAGMNAAAEVARTRGYRDRIILALMRQPGKIVREYAAAALEFPQQAGTIRNQAPVALARCCQSRGPFAGGMIEYLLTKAPNLLRACSVHGGRYRQWAPLIAVPGSRPPATLSRLSNRG